MVQRYHFVTSQFTSTLLALEQVYILYLSFYESVLVIILIFLEKISINLLFSEFPPPPPFEKKWLDFVNFHCIYAKNTLILVNI